MMEMEKTVLKIGRSTRYGIMAEISRLCIQPKGLFEIYCTNPKKFTYSQLKATTSQMMELKLLQKRGEKYQTTAKGREFVQKFEELLNHLKSDTEESEK